MAYEPAQVLNSARLCPLAAHIPVMARARLFPLPNIEGPSCSPGNTMTGANMTIFITTVPRYCS